MKIILLITVLFLTKAVCPAQEYVTIQGRVVDNESNAHLPYATIGIKGKGIGTVSNNLGEFSFNFPAVHENDTLFISMLGYADYKAVIKNINPRNGVTIGLVVEPILLEELSVRVSLTGKEIVEIAVKNIQKNYPQKPFVMEGFFRQIQMVDSGYTSILEAAVNIFNSGYSSATKEKVDVIEIRKSHYLNTKNYLNIADTFYTQKHNALNSTLTFNRVRDIASSKVSKNSFYQGKYIYKLNSTLYDDDGKVYIISATQKINKGYLKDREKENRVNTLLVDASTFAIKKVIFHYSPKDDYDPGDFRNVTKTNDSILSVVTGHTHAYEFGSYNGLQYLKYIRWSDWVKDYNLNSQKTLHCNEYRHELIINRIITEPANFPAKKEPADPTISLHLQAKEYIYNPEFWKNYNIIKETPLDKRMIEELEREVPLQEQFRHE